MCITRNYWFSLKGSMMILTSTIYGRLIKDAPSRWGTSSFSRWIIVNKYEQCLVSKALYWHFLPYEQNFKITGNFPVVSSPTQLREMTLKLSVVVNNKKHVIIHLTVTMADIFSGIKQRIVKISRKTKRPKIWIFIPSKNRLGFP